MSLDLDQSAHDLNNALTLAYLADAAYDDAPPDNASFRKTAFKDVITFASGATNTQGFVTANARHVVVAFRGTQEAQDWLTDLDFVMRPDAGANVHRGFAEALDSVWDKMRSAITGLQGNGQTLWIAGHSLGGAVASLAGWWLADELDLFATMTFGQPRVGDDRFAQSYAVRHCRFVNNRDIIPTVPPRIVPGSLFPPAFYTHVGELKFFDENGDLVQRSGEELGVLPELQEALAPLADGETAARALIRQGLRDHKIENYIKCLKQNQPPTLAAAPARGSRARTASGRRTVRTGR